MWFSTCKETERKGKDDSYSNRHLQTIGRNYSRADDHGFKAHKHGQVYSEESFSSWEEFESDMNSCKSQDRIFMLSERMA